MIGAMAPTKTLLVPSLLVSVLYSIPNFRISQHKFFINVVFPYPTYTIFVSVSVHPCFSGERKHLKESLKGQRGRGVSQKSQFHRCCRMITTAKLILLLEIVCCMRI